MTNSRRLCVLVAEIVGGDRLITRLGEAETVRAIDRCLNRVDLAVGSSGGEIVARDRSALISTFDDCGDAVLAACEAIDRVRKLPPVSGIQMQLRIGIHYGEAENSIGDGADGARLILQACNADQSMASAAVIDELKPAVRKFASAEAYHDAVLDRLPWPVFLIGTQSTTTSLSSSMLPPSPRPEPTSPLTSVRPMTVVEPLPAAQPSFAAQPLPAAQPSFVAQPAIPPAAQPTHSPRMQLKHQQNTLLMDGSRPVVLLGRELGNDIVIIDPRASRQHARIERRRDGFMLIDESTNGSFVFIEGQEEQCLKGTSLPLTGSGRIGCGFSPKEFENDLVFFELF